MQVAAATTDAAVPDTTGATAPNVGVAVPGTADTATGAEVQTGKAVNANRTAATTAQGSTTAQSPATAGTAATRQAGTPTKSLVRLGSVGTFSGPVGAVVKDTTTGPRVWAQWVNSHGGLNGHPVEVLVGDDGGDPGRYNFLLKQFVELRRRGPAGENTKAPNSPCSSAARFARAQSLDKASAQRGSRIMTGNSRSVRVM